MTPKSWFSPILVAATAEPPTGPKYAVYVPKQGHPLTGQESRVLELLTSGNSMKGAARLMGVEASTAQTHAARAKAKLGAASTEQAAVIYDRAKRAVY